MLEKVDKVIGFLWRYLAANHLLGNTNVILLSDHGMKTVRPRNFLDLNKHIDKKLCKLYGKTPGK